MNTTAHLVYGTAVGVDAVKDVASDVKDGVKDVVDKGVGAVKDVADDVADGVVDAAKATAKVSTKAFKGVTGISKKAYRKTYQESKRSFGKIKQLAGKVDFDDAVSRLVKLLDKDTTTDMCKQTCKASAKVVLGGKLPKADQKVAKVGCSPLCKAGVAVVQDIAEAIKG
ncbi:hypothetical protein ElyMa_002307700 [Elysia marginata]|uniref:Saposin B-type domain-containing protein n=1 Tax=Elysia marginata TaxID=1093978 RepID=A0AAV4G596_9GAST|nr:hypothetical protein ElyMa_002307700 [Elysia marginata]